MERQGWDNKDISTHALREEGDPIIVKAVHVIHISTHALREEGDKCIIQILPAKLISTHALREEGDEEDTK